MSAPFTDKDFLSGNWQTLDDLARRTDGAFPVAFSSFHALDFDEIKNSVCAYRGWGLCSVDAVTIAEDGRIFLIEFKDTQRNPIAWLRKKGFDSLVIFWLAVGHDLTMEQIRDRAVFCYVSTKEERYDDQIAQDLNELAGEPRTSSMPDQLENLRNSGLYGEVCHFSPEEFGEMIERAGISRSVQELKGRLSLQYRPSLQRPEAPMGDTASSDFKSDVLSLAELRMPCPFDLTAHQKHPAEVLHVAEKYDAGTNMVMWCHDWSLKFPVMNLVSRCFDSFVLWSLSFCPDKKISDLGSVLRAKVSFKGDALESIAEPPDVPSRAYQRRFWEIFSPHYSQKYGLVVHEQECLYGQIDMT